jgi:hypothetical protein
MRWMINSAIWPGRAGTHRVQRALTGIGLPYGQVIGLPKTASNCASSRPWRVRLRALLRAIGYGIEQVGQQSFGQRVPSDDLFGELLGGVKRISLRGPW